MRNRAIMALSNKMMRHPALAKWLVLSLVLIALGGAIAFNLALERDRTAARERDRLSAQVQAGLFGLFAMVSILGFHVADGEG